jgi:uncharacterized protein YjbI with pentapeptide repeats
MRLPGPAVATMIDPPETPDSLRERWKSGIWKEALDAILAEAARTTRSISAEFLGSLSFPHNQGRLDLRGIPFYEPLDPKIYGYDKCPLRLCGDEYKNMDLSYATVRFYVGGTRITNCSFCKSTLESCTLSDCTISNCDFSHAFMPWLSIGKGACFVHTCFDHTKIRHDASIYGYANFEKCSFLNLDWRMLKLNRCLFNDCTFSGHLQKAHADCSSSHGLSAIRNCYLKLKYKGCNIFKNCSFDKLKFTRFSVENGSLFLLNCTGFPTYSLPSEEFRADRDFYSDDTKPEKIL